MSIVRLSFWNIPVCHRIIRRNQIKRSLLIIISDHCVDMIDKSIQYKSILHSTCMIEEKKTWIVFISWRFTLKDLILQAILSLWWTELTRTNVLLYWHKSSFILAQHRTKPRLKCCYDSLKAMRHFFVVVVGNVCLIFEWVKSNLSYDS